MPRRVCANQYWFLLIGFWAYKIEQGGSPTLQGLPIPQGSFKDASKRWLCLEGGGSFSDVVADVPAVCFSSFNLKALIFIIRRSLPTYPLFSTYNRFPFFPPQSFLSEGSLLKQPPQNDIHVITYNHELNKNKHSSSKRKKERKRLKDSRSCEGKQTTKISTLAVNHPSTDLKYAMGW